MQRHGFHFSYCTNIHPAETLGELTAALDQHLPAVRRALPLEPGQPLGLGLRFSAQMAAELQEPAALEAFQQKLAGWQAYALCVNGFPYGAFHGRAVKDRVHQPDWSTPERLEYSVQLAKALAALLPADCSEAGISTSPLSYAPWCGGEPMRLWEQHVVCARQLAQALWQLRLIYEQTGKTIFLELEPEPDGLLETSQQTADFLKDYLLLYGKETLMNLAGCTEAQAIEWLLLHLRICWDVCHFSVLYEEPAAVCQTLRNAGWRIGRLQASAAMMADLTENATEKLAALQAFAEPTYLHQVAAQTVNGRLLRYTDLPMALDELAGRDDIESLRTHFHVPLFVGNYGLLQSTQDAVSQCLALLKDQPFTRVIEAETYTWQVLPQDLQQDLATSVAREINWLEGHFK